MSASPHPDLRPEPPPLVGAETAIEAADRATPHGSIWVARALYPDLYRHGRVHVATARAWEASGLAQLAREPRAARLALEGWAFLDIETTGLGTRAGTVAFLVGLGWMERDGFRIEQILLRDPGDEPALLHEVASRLAAFGGIVTYNGKAFDLPVLGTRFALARRPPPSPELVHCDLLHAARRVWAHRLESCRLTMLERRVLGLRREGDVDGRLVPDLYMDYLRRGDGRLLDPVLAHNRADLLSLLLVGAEAARFLDRARDPASERVTDPEGQAADRLQAARVFWLTGEERDAATLLERCLAGGASPPVRIAARALLAYIRKRQGDLAAACRLWEEQLQDDPTLVEPVEELAKVDEHRRRDPAAALARVQGRLAGAPLDAGSEAALRHRGARLARKLGASGAGGNAQTPVLWGVPGTP